MLLQLWRSRSPSSEVLPKTSSATALLIAPAATLALIDSQPRNALEPHFSNRLPLQRRGQRKPHNGRVVVGLLHLHTREP